MAAINVCVPTTGCGKCDRGENTCRGNFGRTTASRLDHVFMTPALYEALLRVEVQHSVQVSDYRPLSLCLLCALTDVDIRTPGEQNSGPGEIRRVVRWQEEARPAYAEEIDA